MRIIAIFDHSLFFFPFFLLCFFFAASAQDSPVIARAGSVFISEREFIERFELTPGLYRHRKPQLEKEKLEVLYSMIAEKLLAQEALSRNLDRDSLYQNALREVTKLIARDALYRQEVRSRVAVTSLEIVRGMTQARTQVRVRFIFTPHENDARFIKGQIATPVDLARLQLDSTMDALRDTATVVWGEADTTIEAAAYALTKGEVSPVLHAGDGYYILSVVARESNPFYTNLTDQVLHERVETRIRVRKEKVREAEFRNEVMHKVESYSPQSSIRQFAINLDAVLRHHYRPPATTLNREMMEELVSMSRDILADTLLVAGTEAWSVRQGIERLFTRGFSVSGDTVRGIPGRLRDLLQEWAEQEILAQEALRRGLDRLPEVVNHLIPWRDHYLAGIVRQRLNRQLSVTDAETYGYLRAEGRISSVPQVQVRQLRTSDLTAMSEALDLLEKGVPFEKVVEQLDSDPWARTHGGLSEYVSVADRPEMGDILLRMDPGQIYGPVRDSAGVLLIQLVGKRNLDTQGDSSSVERLESAKKEVLRMKRQRMLTLLLAQLAKSYGFEVYGDRVEHLEVTALPMVAFRLLGFGGRMFDVPFVEKQLEWLETEAPKEMITP